MAFAGNVKSGMHGGGSGQRQRYGTAEAQRADVTVVPHHHPARGGGRGSDPKGGAHRIDGEQYEDDPEASERGACKVGRVKPSAAIGQARQQQRDADAAFGERDDKGEGRERQRHRHMVRRDHQRHAQEGDHRADAR